jgi:hypothetical protein
MNTIDVKRMLVMSNKLHLIVNAVVFQIAWLLCVLGGSMVAVVVTAFVLALHFQWVRDQQREAAFLLQCVAVGLACDLSLIYSGVLITAGALPPLWLTCLWPLFGSTVGYALRPFHGRFLLCVAGGALLAPLSYLGGVRLSGISLLEPTWLALTIIGMIWAVIFPLLVHLYTVNRLRTSA